MFRFARMSFPAALAFLAISCTPTKVTPPVTGMPEPDAGPAGVTARACDNTTDLPVTLAAMALARSGVTVVQAETATGGSYVSGFDHPGKRLGFTFCAPTDGYFTFSFRYMNGTGAEATRSLVIDGITVPGKVRFLARYDPARLEPVVPSAAPVRSVRLTKGRHDVELLFDADDRGSVDLDAITLSAGPQPSAKSVSALMMNNWSSLVGVHYAPETIPQVKEFKAPRLGELHFRDDWSTNQVQELTGFLRDDTDQVAYTDFKRSPFQSDQYLDQNGVVVSNALAIGETPLPAMMTKEYAMVPNEDFLLVRYTLTNVSTKDKQFSMLEYAHPRAGLNGVVSAGWREDLQAWVYDMHATHGTWLIFGALQPVASRGAFIGPAGENDLGVIRQFSNAGSLNGVSTLEAADVESGLVSQVLLAKGAAGQVAYFYGLANTLERVEAIALRVKTRSVAAWFTAQNDAWAAWRAEGIQLQSTDPAIKAAYDLSLVSIKQSQQPEFGSFVASTNPTYAFKVWPRDSAAVALGLDASGHLAEAEKYWLWMASVQEKGTTENFPRGTWYTNYDFWKAAKAIPFVDPEWDSLGLFLVGSYRHYQLLLEKDPSRASTFLAKIAPVVVDAATFIEQGAADPLNHGFGPKDNSIWEDKYQWATFTQVTYAAGLYAATAFAALPGVSFTDRSAGWLATARSIRDAITRPYVAASCNGLWSAETSSFLRGVNPDCTPDLRTDASSNLIAVMGLLAADDVKAAGHRTRTVARLQPQQSFNVEGVSRFEFDDFYYSSIYSPGGQYESKVPEPVWPQMSMYVGMGEHWVGQDEAMLARLHWFISVMGVGFMAPGEAVDWSTQQLLVSTAIEPVTASWFALGALTFTNQYDVRQPRDP